MTLSLGVLLREQASRFSGRTLFRFEGRSLSFREIERATNRLANVLVARGLSAGDRVAVMLPNGIEFPVAWFAIAKVGAVMVPVNVQYRDRDLEHGRFLAGARDLHARLCHAPAPRRRRRRYGRP